MSDFDFRQFEQFAERWEQGTRQFEPFLRKFITEMAMRLLAKVKPRTPVDTGALRESWQLGEYRFNGGNVEIDILNPMDYATFIEFGARSVDGTWREGRFMLTISMDEIQQQMPDRFQRDLRAWMVERGMA